MTEDVPRVVMRSPIATLFAEPRVASAPISQLLAGRIAEVLEARDDWFRIRGPDAYEGWMNRGFIEWATEDASPKHDAEGIRLSLGCVTRTSSGARRQMPLGALLTADEQVTSGTVITASEQALHFPTNAQAIIRSALSYFEGTSYVWGGVTPWGGDCSGLVQSVFWLHGVQLRRDAWQQAGQGVDGEQELRDAKAGDLLFFSDRVDRYITHVAIAMGNQRLVHLALGRGGFAVENLANTEDSYVRKLGERFVTARRILE
ncbi:C40 family peptidase [soil metagenome]